ncbi:MAG: zinc ribbon domain-containing protein [Thermodesulfovibrionales bacterium]|nr:zinc ribbon domain-containing protein [Thermodesulfovibrionales bacterium]
MPIYEYQCTSCGEQLEVMQKISDPRLTVCPECGGELSKLISNTSFVLKGGGWYADGYSNSSNGEGKAGPEMKDKKNGKKAEGKPSSSGKGSSEKTSSSSEKPAKKAAASGA